MEILRERKIRETVSTLRFPKRTFPVLLSQELGSMASGIMWIRNQNRTVAGFASQFVGLEAVNAIPAALGLSSAKSNLEQHGQARSALRSFSIKRKNLEA
jgi:hypothetical protein